MFWMFILLTALAFTFVKFGAYSVLVTILSGGLQLALIVIAFLGIAFMWRRHSGK